MYRRTLPQRLRFITEPADGGSEGGTATAGAQPAPTDVGEQLGDGGKKALDAERAQTRIYGRD